MRRAPTKGCVKTRGVKIRETRQRWVNQFGHLLVLKHPKPNPNGLTGAGTDVEGVGAQFDTREMYFVIISSIFFQSKIHSICGKSPPKVSLHVICVFRFILLICASFF